VDRHSDGITELLIYLQQDRGAASLSGRFYLYLFDNSVFQKFGNQGCYGGTVDLQLPGCINPADPPGLVYNLQNSFNIFLLLILLIARKNIPRKVF